MQDILVYIIVIATTLYVVWAFVKKILLLAKPNEIPQNICDGCSGCQLSQNSGACNSILKQIEKFN